MPAIISRSEAQVSKPLIGEEYPAGNMIWSLLSILQLNDVEVVDQLMKLKEARSLQAIRYNETLNRFCSLMSSLQSENAITQLLWFLNSTLGCKVATSRKLAWTGAAAGCKFYLT
jgi:hypothetical protein